MDTTQLAASVARSLAGSGGRRKADAELFNRILARIHRYFRKLIYDAEEAEECLQETLLLLERSLQEGKFDPNRSFNTWIWLKARSVYIQSCRNRERRAAPLHDVDRELVGRSEGHGLVERQLDAAAILAQVSEQLGKETYEAFVLYYEGELSHEEIGELLGRGRKTISRRIEQAHALIQRLLAESSTGDHSPR